jgi:hypothetical protein
LSVIAKKVINTDNDKTEYIVNGVKNRSIETLVPNVYKRKIVETTINACPMFNLSTVLTMGVIHEMIMRPVGAARDRIEIEGMPWKTFAVTPIPTANKMK